MNKELRDITDRLKEMAEREAINLWRIARRAIKHGVSAELVAEIREEADTLWYEMKTYPDRLIYWKTKYDFKYAFMGEGRR